MQRPAVERRRQQGRWRLAEPEERGEFRIRVKQLVASGKDQVDEEQVVMPERPATPAVPQPTPDREPMA
jgi:hypothetical protein